MFFLHFRRLLIGILLLCTAPLLQAQDATPEVTPDPDGKIAVGAVALQVPEGWYLIEGQRGEPILSNVDLLASAPEASLPADAVLVQINILSKITLPPDFHAIQTGREFLEAIPVPEGQDPAEVTEIELADATFARINTSSPEADSAAYVLFLSDDTLVFALTATTQPGVIDLYENIVLEALLTLEVDTSAPLPEDIAERYQDIPQSRTAEGFPQLGNPDAPVTIVEISSFDCPACRSFHDFAFPVILERIQAGEVLFIYVPIYGTGSIPNGEFAARAAVCAAEQNAFWELHDGLFSWQDFRSLAYIGERVTTALTALELDTAAHTACLSSESVTTILQTALTTARSTPGFSGTPTVLLNGTIINWTPEVLNQLIDDAVSAAANATPEATSEGTAEATVEPTAIGSGF
jgi:protein-disulfide isomerase